MNERGNNERQVGGIRGWGALVIGGVVAAGVLAGMGGCGSSDPNRPLTEDEGAALLKSVRKSPPRPDDLTPAEKKYLKNYLAK